MRFGIDAKWYFNGPPSGKRVVRALTNAMVNEDDAHEYVIFLDRSARGQQPDFPQKKNITLCYIWAGNNLLSNLFVLPFHARKYGLDAILFQNFVSPFGRPQKVAYIHDVLFLSNPEFYTLAERLYFAPLRFLTKRSNRIITVSEEEKKRLIRHRFSDEGRIHVVYHGIDKSFVPLSQYAVADQEETRRRYRLPKRFILFVGRLNLRKNVDNLLRAIPLLRDKDIPLVVVGDPDWKTSNHQSTIEQLNIRDRILFTGAVYDGLGIIYAMSTVFCFPSFAESFGLPPLEAMASGVPVVVSRTTSLPEVCGDAATYIDPHKPASIAEAIDNLLTNGQLYEQKAAQGIKQAARFTWAGAAHAVIEVMKSPS